MFGKRQHFPWFLCFLLGVGLVFVYFSKSDGSSNRGKPERDDPLFKKGQRCLQENRNDEALLLFSRLAEQRVFCPETHFELGQLYLSIKKDPVFSMYHLRRYLEQSPDGKLTRLVSGLIETAKKEFIRSLPLNDRYTESPERNNLVDVLQQTRAENARLKSQLAQERLSKTVAGKAVPEAVALSVPLGEQRVYTVQTNDSLSRISFKMYGNASKWQTIYEANRDVLQSPTHLRIGMRLRIPVLKSEKKTPTKRMP